MTDTTTTSEQKVLPLEEKRTSLMDNLFDKLVDYINKADETAAAERVAKLREDKPQATIDELVEELVRRKIFKTGVVGAVTSGAALVPGLGTFASLTFGVAADIGMTFKLQAELVLEIAAAHDHPLTEAEKEKVILLVTGISAGANQLLTRAGTKISQEATERLVQKSVAKAIPVLGIAVSGGVNALSTYIIGQRADAYFSLGEEEMDDWATSIRAISGVDERKLSQWLSKATWSSWEMVRSGTKWASNTAGDFLQDKGRDLVSWGKWAGEQVVDAGEFAADKVLWWRRDKIENPKLPPDEIIEVVDDQTAALVPEQVVAVINAEDEIDTPAAEQIAAAQALIDGRTEEDDPSVFSYLNPRNWFDNDDEDEDDTTADSEEGLRIFSPRSWFRNDEEDSKG
ncbi:MAG: hypothetical protein KDE51_14300 [Anaerolineales bacterium]|nr:hypothetical protein [Anaerolineales bacterium]